MYLDLADEVDKEMVEGRSLELGHYRFSHAFARSIHFEIYQCAEYQCPITLRAHDRFRDPDLPFHPCSSNAVCSTLPSHR
jgi:hypothetical protein